MLGYAFYEAALTASANPMTWSKLSGSFDYLDITNFQNITAVPSTSLTYLQYSFHTGQTVSTGGGNNDINASVELLYSSGSLGLIPLVLTMEYGGAPLYGDGHQTTSVDANACSGQLILSSALPHPFPWWFAGGTSLVGTGFMSASLLFMSWGS